MKRSPLTIIYLTVFIDLLGFGIILPVLPFYATKLGATGVWVGALLTAYSAAQFIAAPILGQISDRIGRRPVLLLSLLGSAISLTVSGLAQTLALLLIGRALAGLFGGSIATAQAYIADVTQPHERTKYMGLLGASIGMGFVLGPAIGAGLSPFGFGTAAFAAAGLAAVNLIFAFFALPESRQPGSAAAHQGFSFASLGAALGHPAIGRILGATFLTTFAFVGMETTFALLGKDRFNLGAGGLGIIFTYVGIVIALVQGGLIGRLNARFGERKLAVAGTALMGLTLLLLPLAPGLILALVILGFLSLGQGLASPTLSSLLAHESGEGQRGQVLGLGQSLSAGARAVGPLVAGWLFDRGMAIPYILGGALVFVAALLLAQLVASAATPAMGAGGAH